MKLKLAMAAAAFVLLGCSQEPPKCSDPATLSLVRSIIVNQTIAGGTSAFTAKQLESIIRLETPRAIVFDEKVKRYSCEARLLIDMKMGELQIDTQLQYESQLDDKREQLAVVKGIDPRFANLIGQALERHHAELNQPAPQAPKEQMAAQPSPGGPTAAEPASTQTSLTQTVPVPVVSAPAPAAAQTPASISAQAQAVDASTKWVPSFDCAKASTPIEKAICGDALLGRLDGALAENYRHMLASDIGVGAKGDLKATQRKWLEQRNKCANSACLTSAYRKRMGEVCEYPVLSGMHPVCTESDEVK